MTEAQIAKLVATIVSALSTSNKPRKTGTFKRKVHPFDTSKLSPAVVSDRDEKQLNRYAAVARGFNRKGLKNSEFTLSAGGSDTVKTYKGWLHVGRSVKRGQHGVKGLFHISQTSELLVNREPVTVPAGQVAVAA